MTTALTAIDSSQTTGLASVAIRSRSGAANSASETDRCSAIRLGASSPSTRLTNVMHTVTIPNASGEATSPDTLCRISQPCSSPTSVSAPKEPATSVASVTPICTAERNRFGSDASRAAVAPRLPRLPSDRTWPSRSETSAISDAEKNPPMDTMTRTMTTSRTTLLTLRSPTSSVAHPLTTVPAGYPHFYVQASSCRQCKRDSVCARGGGGI